MQIARICTDTSHRLSAAPRNTVYTPLEACNLPPENSSLEPGTSQGLLSLQLYIAPGCRLSHFSILAGLDRRMWFGFYPKSSLFSLPCCKIDAVVLTPRVAQGENNSTGLLVLTFSDSPALYELILIDFWVMVKLMSTVLSLESRGGVILNLPSCKNDELSWRGWKKRMDNISANKSSAAIKIAFKNVYYRHK